MNPLVSIIIPTYNRAQYLPDAIRSALNQTYNNIEVIVVDDGSTDNTEDVIAEFASDPRFHYHKKENGGCASARNFGLKHAQGEFVEHLDSDDILVDQDVELKIDAFKSIPEDVAGVFSDCVRWVRKDNPEEKTFFENIDFVESLEPITQDYDDEKKLYLLSRQFYKWHLTRCLITPNILLRSGVYATVGLYDESMSAGQDWYWFTCLLRQNRVAYLDVPLMNYRFWIKGNTSDPLLLSSNSIQMFRILYGEEQDSMNRTILKNAIAKAHFNRSYANYRRGNRWMAIQDAFTSFLGGHAVFKSLGVITACILPGALAKILRPLNPFRGSPIN